MDMLARFKADPLPFARLLGIELVSAAPERIVGHMTVREDLCTRPAVLHGGAIMAFADTLGALGTIANLHEGAGTVTIDSKTNFVGKAPLDARLIGEATPVHLGSHDGLADADYDPRWKACRADDADAARALGDTD
jgi:uncharacterized protein (TIGR00369 family)